MRIMVAESVAVGKTNTVLISQDDIVHVNGLFRRGRGSDDVSSGFGRREEACPKALSGARETAAGRQGRGARIRP
jgi:hypothetical protein